ncbi:MAG TPA: LysR family transcriptional regulator, partial [Microcoleaceae bacterium UBA10368]|nr:LysR family transcriptional regulator [Microcoleaceae cyanobacterium UBA10368]
LSLICNPNRYRSKAAEAFSNEILPLFATYQETGLKTPSV